MPTEKRYKRPAKKVVKEEPAVQEEVKVEEIEEKVKEIQKEDPKPKKVKKGKVIPPALNVRTTPETGNNILCTISKNTEVIINNEKAPVGWYNITAENIPGVTVTGYVMSKFIKEV